MRSAERKSKEADSAVPTADGIGRYRSEKNKQTNDGGSFIWAVIGFLIPPLGLLLWFLWLDRKPKSGKIAIMGALVSTIFSVFLWMILFAPVYSGV